MEFKQINQLMLAMGRAGVKKLVIKKDGFELELEREEKHLARSVESHFESLEDNSLRMDFESQRLRGVMTSAQESAAQVPRAVEEIKEQSAPGTFITAPMVGTFYQSPSPNDPSFVKVGDRVEKNTVVGIIEAMKVMNEIKAGVSGIVAEILLDNSHPVEFGTKLFRITPAQ